MNRLWLGCVGVLIATALPLAAAAQLCPEDLDGVTAPALPNGWTSSASGTGTGWQTVTSDSDTDPNAAFAGDAAGVGESWLMSPPTVIDDTNSTISFRHHYATEVGFDGGVLEISLGGPFEDIIAAGGSFITGGYNSLISSSYQSPIGGRQAWSGNSGGYVSTIVELPPDAVGASTVLRWRMATDSSVAATGWFVDTIECGAVNPVSNPSGWRYGPEYPIPILDQATAVIGDTLYSFGGVNASTTIADAYRFDGEQWTAIAPLPQPLEFPTAVTDGTYIYILGGADSDGVPSNELYRYTPETDSYDALAPFATAAWNTAAAIADGKIVKFGGFTNSGSTDVTEIYVIADDAWLPGAPYPFALGYISAFVYNGSVHGAGGVESGIDGIARANTYRYDGAWIDADIANLPDVRWGAATIVTPEGVILAGGYVGGSATANISDSSIAWDAASDTWHAYDSLLAPRARMTGARFGGAPIVIGGRGPEGGFAGHVEVQIYDRLFANGFEAPN